MKGNILFLSRIIPEIIKEEVKSKSINTMDAASISLQEKLIRGIDSICNKNIKLINVLPIRSYPKGYKEPFVKEVHFSHRQGVDDISIRFCNIYLLKRLFQKRILTKEIKKWIITTDENQTIVAYTPYPEFLAGLKVAKKLNKSIKTCIIVPDLPKFLGVGEGNRGKLYRAYNQKVLDNFLPYIDSFVFLTEQMSGVINKLNKPYIVMEGICSFDFPKFKTGKKTEINTIFYGGTLHKAFGIKNLLDAFCLIKNPNIILEICGIGDMEDFIKDLAEKDKRIHFLGQIDRNKVLGRMQTSDLIVNPRTSEGDFTKYSFPSKNLEALSSGVPFVGYKLPGIPNDYDKYINYPIDETPEKLKKMIEEIFNDYRKYVEKASRAKEYVLNNKDEVSQCQKIVNLLEGL